MEPRISLITLGVADLERSTAFYRDGLGLPVRPESSPNAIVFIDMGHTWLALFPRAELAADVGVPPAGSGFPGITLAHNVREREDVDAVLAQASKAGAEIVSPARFTDWGGYSGYFKDPDGFPWEVAWNPHFWIE
jgi:catechol 2,3-dioxygenase-like lactoylglutathione lyase family enzyme